MDKEPTVLDYFKSLITPWRGKPMPIPPLESEPATSPDEGDALLEKGMELSLTASTGEVGQVEVKIGEAVVTQPVALPWRGLIALGLALVAQISLEPRPNRSWEMGIFLYLWAAGWLAWATFKGEWSTEALPAAEKRADDYRVRTRWLLVTLPLALSAYIFLGGNRFNFLNLTLWSLAVATTVLTFWQGGLPWRRWWAWLRAHIRPPWHISISAWTLTVLAVAGLALFFRSYRLETVPPEMVSDHAEKLLDIWDVLHGQTSIFFPRNTGREAIQMYLTAGIVQLFDTGFTFLSLKIGTVLAGLCTLPYIYLLGKEMGSRRIGLLAVAFAGMAYWPNVISRAGLRFPLYPLFVAPTLYYLIRGLRTTNRNDFILAGLALGVGLHGYTPIRILPIVVVTAVGLYLLHRQAKGVRLQAVAGLCVVALVALVVFLPLLRFSWEYPDLFGFRAISRLGTIERPLPGPVGLIFLKNLWNALVMFGWSNGNIWVHSVTGRPALDIVSAALYHLGLLTLLIRYLRQRQWQDLLVLLSVPLLMLPSILSLAYPDENPALNRAAGAMVPVFLIVGVALDGLMISVKSRGGEKLGAALGWGAATLLVAWSALHNYDLVFNQYQRSYELSAWNTSEIGQVIRDFGELTGSTETAWVVAYPHWVDTRLVGMNAGDTTRDYAIWPDHFVDTLTDTRPKLFLINLEDLAALEQLQAMYPQGNLQTYQSQVNKNFWVFFVPGNTTR